MENIFEKYRNNTFNYLSNREGFNLEEIKSNSNTIWCATKMQNNICIAFAFFFDISDKYQEQVVVNTLNSRDVKYNLFSVYLTENSMDNNFYNNNYYAGNVRVNRIILNPITNNILYADESYVNIANIIIQINNQNNIQKNNKKNINGHNTYVTYILIGVNILLYIISAIKAGNFFDIDIMTLYSMGGKFAYNIYHGEAWRLVTAMFLHGGITHILFNMYSLYILGTQIEVIFGKVKYLIIYFISGIAANILSCIIAPNTLSIGASGAIFGLLGALASVIFINRKRMSKGAVTNLIVVILLNVYIGFTGQSIDNAAHIGGLVAGILVSFIIIFIYNKRKAK